MGDDAEPDPLTIEIQQALFRGNKIAAIKAHRTATGQGLKESKDFVEAVERELRQVSPEKFTAAPGGGCGSAVLACVCSLAIVAIAMVVVLAAR